MATVKKDLKIYNANQGIIENIWAVNLIDTILSQLNRSATNDFEEACTLLEISCEVYSQRVDSVYADVMRISDELKSLKEGDGVESRNTADPRASTVEVCEEFRNEATNSLKHTEIAKEEAD